MSSAHSPDRVAYFCCDVCETDLFEGDVCWFLKDGAPIRYSDNGTFCLCEPCGSKTGQGSLCRARTQVSQNPEDYLDTAWSIFQCCGHNTQETCLCRCAACGKAGHRDSDKEWSCGIATLPGVCYEDVSFMFVLCPDCAQDSSVQANNSEKWFDQHLEKRHMKSVENWYHDQLKDRISCSVVVMK